MLTKYHWLWSFNSIIITFDQDFVFQLWFFHSVRLCQVYVCVCMGEPHCIHDYLPLCDCVLSHRDYLWMKRGKHTRDSHSFPAGLTNGPQVLIAMLSLKKTHNRTIKDISINLSAGKGTLWTFIATMLLCCCTTAGLLTEDVSRGPVTFSSGLEEWD